MKRTQYFKWGLTAFLTVCAVLVFYDTFYQDGTLQGFLSQLASILSPVLYGFAIAFSTFNNQDVGTLRIAHG